MNREIITSIKNVINVSDKQIIKVMELLNAGNTVPFIARYRKEMTNSLNEEEIRVIEKEFIYQQNLIKRKEEIIKLIDQKGMLTIKLQKAIKEAKKLQQIEDIYLPFKEKRKTKATQAIKYGVEPLAEYILSFPFKEGSIKIKAEQFINKDIKNIDQAIEQAGYIIAEKISETAKYREFIRNNIYNFGEIKTKLKPKNQKLDEKKKYEMYYDFNQKLNKIPSYRILAFNRAEKEKVLTVKIEYSEQKAIEYLNRQVIKKISDSTNYLINFINDGYTRLIFPAIEREIRNLLTERASKKAIELFSQNLDKLIMQPPLKEKIVLGVDPAFRTGCKLAVIDKTSKTEKIDVIYPTAPKNDILGSEKKIKQILVDYQIDQIVIGNGTASRETEQFFKNFLEKNNFEIALSIVSEAGASVYSASKIAQEEFPTLAVEERSAISIARRIQDPMAELVKIDPKSIGIGQYQHDVNQKELAENLDFVMIKNINQVGIDLNTASKELLKYVSGLDKTIAKNIVNYRNENGSFKKRSELKKVTRLGAKAYEQAAGFLKIIEGKQPLDNTFIHPESYKIAQQIIKELNIDLNEITLDSEIKKLNKANSKELAKKLEHSIILVNDIINALKSPNIDIRSKIKVANFDSQITKIEDLKIGMVIEGQIRNIVDFGGFVDIGLKNDALIHISELSNNYVKSVQDIISIGQIKKFRVKAIDTKKGRIQLSLKEI